MNTRAHPDDEAHSTPRDDARDAADMLRRLRLHHEGVLATPDATQRIQFVLDPSTGAPVFPAPDWVLHSEHLALYLPDDTFDNPECLQLSASPQAINPDREAACDRYHAYFATAHHAHWVRCTIDSIKRLDTIVDGSLLTLANPLARAEGALCRAANAHTHALIQTCKDCASVSPEQPALVGVDPWGIDIRARFGIIRIEFPTLVSTPEEALAAISALLNMPLTMPPPSPRTPQ